MSIPREKRIFHVLAGLCLVFNACVTPLPVPEHSPEPAKISAQPPPASRSREDRPLTCSVLGHGSDGLLVLGGIHGEEPAGAVLAQAFLDHLLDHWELLHGKRVVILPEANPDGLAVGQRLNRAGVDLNRNFASSNRTNNRRFGKQALSEPESRYIVELIERYQPDRIVSIHQPLTCVDWDGPARELAMAMAHAAGLPLKKLGTRPGSLGAYAGETLGIPLITLELPGGASVLEQAELWDRYGASLLLALRPELTLQDRSP